MLDTIAMAEQLSGEYRSAFERADIYSTGTMGEDQLDEKMMDLYKRLLEAEQNKQPVEDVVGTDIELFCENYFVREKTKFTLKMALDILFKVMCGLFIYTVCLLVLDEEKSNLLPFVAGFISGSVVDVVDKHWLRPIIFKNKKIKPIVHYLIVSVLSIGIFIGIWLLGHNIGAVIVIPIRQLFLIAATYISIYCVVRLIWQYKERGSFLRDFSEKKESKKAKKEFNKELHDKVVFNAVAQGMASRFLRIRNRKQKKGQEYTFRDFAQLIQKENKFVKKGDAIFLIIVVSIVLVPGINIIIEETLFDGLCFISIMGVVEYFICRFFLKSSARSMQLQLSILEECEQSGKDIIGYLENDESKDIE